MRKININRVRPVRFILLVSLLLTGCQNGLWGGMRNLESDYSGSGAVADISGRSAEAGELKAPPAPHEKEPKPSSLHGEDKLLSRLLDLRNPEELTPLATTPGQFSQPREESVPVSADIRYRNALLIEDTTWRGEVLIEGGVTIASQVTLFVENGTVVRFRVIPGTDARAALVVLGRIVVRGTVARPVTFTSTYRQAINGDWQGIVLTGSGKNNQLEHLRVEGAETGIDASFSTVTMKNAAFAGCRTGLRLQDTVALIDGLKAGECGTGLILYDSEADIRSADFFGNRVGLYSIRTSLSLAHSRFSGHNLLALAADKSRVSVSDNSFTANGSGISLVSCEGSVTSNTVSRNAAYGILLKDSRVKVSANDIEGNGKAGIHAEDGKGVAWGNAFLANGEYDIYNDGDEEFRAIGNWWGTGSADAISARIYDRSLDESRGRVLFFPPLQTRPETATLP